MKHLQDNLLSFKLGSTRGAWLAQSVKHPTSTQVTISWFMSLSPALGSVLIAQSLEPASDSVSPSLPLSHSYCFSVCLALFLKRKKIKVKEQKSKKNLEPDRPLSSTSPLVNLTFNGYRALQ